MHILHPSQVDVAGNGTVLLGSQTHCSGNKKVMDGSGKEYIED
jgi:hypothetical protein